MPRGGAGNRSARAHLVRRQLNSNTTARVCSWPLARRMLAIVDAFDSMTTPQVYRPAFSHDRAIKELCDFAGTQFDPQLVVLFAELQSTDQQKLHHRVARRWLQELDPTSRKCLVARARLPD